MVPIYKGEEQAAELMPDARRIIDGLKAAGVRAKLDDRDHLRPGPKFFEWEKKGVPVPLEFGMRDRENGQVVVVRRDTGDKTPTAMDSVVSEIPGLLETIQADLFERAKQLRKDRSAVMDDYDEFKRRIEDGGFFHMRWCGSSECEARIKDETKATIRCLPFEGDDDPGPCILGCGEAGGRRAIFARAY